MANKLSFWLSIVVVTLLLVGALPPHSLSADVNFKGKTITLYNAGSPGGGTDQLSRVVGTFWAKHIPGNPRIIIRNSARGAEVVDFNYLYERAAKNGTRVGASSSKITGAELLQYKIKRFKLAKMPLLVSFPVGNVVIYNKKLLPNGWKDMIAMGDKLISAEGAPAGASNWGVMFFKKLLNPKMKIIFGYNKGPGRAALLSGESMVFHEDSPVYEPIWGKEPEVLPAFTAGMLDDSGNVARDPLLPDVPTLLEIYQEVKGKLPPPEILGAYKAWIGCVFAIGKGYHLPPGTPENIVTTLGNAMVETVKDPKFIKIAGPRMKGYKPYVGESAKKLMTNALDQPPEAQKWLKNWLATEYNVQ